jgi:hypothetical protein
MGGVSKIEVIGGAKAKIQKAVSAATSLVWIECALES